MKIKPIHLILIIIAIAIFIFALSQRPKNSLQNIEKNRIEKTLNKEISSSEIKEEIPLKEDTYEERVKKMYELLPPGEIIIE